MMEVLGTECISNNYITGDKKKNGHKARTRKEPALPEEGTRRKTEPSREQWRHKNLAIIKSRDYR